MILGKGPKLKRDEYVRLAAIRRAALRRDVDVKIDEQVSTDGEAMRTVEER